MKLYRFHNHYTLKVYDVIKETDKGFWIDVGAAKNKFVLKDSRKRYAHTEIPDAVKSFRARKTSQVRILKAQLADALEELDSSSRMGVDRNYYFFESYPLTSQRLD